MLTSGGIILAKITFSLEDQDTRLQLNYTSAGKLKDNDLRDLREYSVTYSV